MQPELSSDKTEIDRTFGIFFSTLIISRSFEPKKAEDSWLSEFRDREVSPASRKLLSYGSAMDSTKTSKLDQR